MKKEASKAAIVLVAAILLGCAPPAEIDILAPDQGNIGDVIAIRDSAQMTLGTEGSVLFGAVEATGVRKWTPTDIYVEVPEGIAGSVPVRIVRGPQNSNAKFFTVVEEDLFPRVMQFGDSLTYWSLFHLQVKMEEDPYLGQFRPLLINHGRRGEGVTDPGTLVRWQDALEFCDCEFAVFMHAVNDLTDTVNPEKEITLGEIQESVIRVIDEIVPLETALILCTLPPRVDSCGDTESPTTEEYNAWLRSYADQRGIPLVDVYEDFVSTPNWGPLYYGGLNCLHPLSDGQERIAELLNERIVELYLPTCTDLDTDGYGDPAAPPCLHSERDCDDSDPAVHPGVVEAAYGDPECSDGLDNDCDGLTDSEDGGCQDCTLPEDCDDGNICTDDDCVDYGCVHTYNTDPCNDGDPCTMNDVCSDGVCDGNALDADGDTYVSDACNGDDCNDSDSDIHPGVIEAAYGDPICSDGSDNDCDGDVDLADSGCRECIGNEDCNDGLWCNGEEMCVGYVCQAGSPPDCGDAIGCTDDACNEATDTCDNLPNDALCDDEDPCTNDVCDSLADCEYACDATGPEDPCCQDPVCSGTPVCEPPP